MTEFVPAIDNFLEFVLDFHDFGSDIRSLFFLTLDEMVTFLLAPDEVLVFEVNRILISTDLVKPVHVKLHSQNVYLPDERLEFIVSEKIV